MTLVTTGNIIVMDEDHTFVKSMISYRVYIKAKNGSIQEYIFNDDKQFKDTLPSFRAMEWEIIKIKKTITYKTEYQTKDLEAIAKIIESVEQ